MNQFLQLRSGEEYVNKKILMFDLVYVGPVIARVSLMTPRHKVEFACNRLIMAAGYSTHTENLLLTRERMLLQSFTVTMHRFWLHYCFLLLFSKRDLQRNKFLCHWAAARVKLMEFPDACMRGVVAGARVFGCPCSIHGSKARRRLGVSHRPVFWLGVRDLQQLFRPGAAMVVRYDCMFTRTLFFVQRRWLFSYFLFIFPVFSHFSVCAGYIKTENVTSQRVWIGIFSKITPGCHS